MSHFIIILYFAMGTSSPVNSAICGSLRDKCEDARSGFILGRPENHHGVEQLGLPLAVPAHLDRIGWVPQYHVDSSDIH